MDFNSKAILSKSAYSAACLLALVLSIQAWGHNRGGDRIATGDGDDERIYAPASRPAIQGPRRNYIKPVDGDFSRRGFGYQRDPFTGASRMHYGQDIRGSFGQKVMAAKDGVIVKIISSCASWSRNRGQRTCGGGFGNNVVIRHADGNYTYYTHMQNSGACPAINRLREGQRVAQRDQIGCVGSSGNSTGPHLHFEVRAGSMSKSSAVNPMGFLRNWG